MRLIKIILNIGWLLCPKFLKTPIINRAEEKKLRRQLENYKHIISKEDIAQLFENMHVDADVLIHTSYPDLGKIEGNNKYIAEELQKVVDAGHTLLFPALPIKGSSLDYLRHTKIFDPSKADNAMGGLSKYYGRQIGACRSAQPTHSVVAYGPKAEYYTNEHHIDETPFTDKSPYYKLIKNKGKILMFGAELTHLTICHVAEDMIGSCYPMNVYSKPYLLEMVLPNGESYAGKYRAHNRRSGIFREGNTSKLIFFAKVLPSTQIYKLGVGEVVLLDAQELIMCELELLKNNYTTLGKLHVSKAAKAKADEWIAKIRNNEL